MKRLRQYDASHPMLVGRTGDPARGTWLPKQKQSNPRRKRRRSR